jgi:hypothetical protein
MSEAFQKALAEVKDVKKVYMILAQRMTIVEHLPLPVNACNIENCQCSHGEIEYGSQTRYCDAGWIINDIDREKETFGQALGCPYCRPYLNKLQQEPCYDIQTVLWKRNKQLRESGRKDHL